MEDFFIRLIIDAREGINVEIFDLPGAYLNTNILEDKCILLNIEGEFVGIMCKVNPKQKKNACVENGVKVLYQRLLKILYGCMESSIMWYDLYSKTLKQQGFLINKYDRCIINITIKYKKLTIAWYVDSNKVSHVYE